MQMKKFSNYLTEQTTAFEVRKVVEALKNQGYNVFIREYSIIVELEDGSEVDIYSDEIANIYHHQGGLETALQYALEKINPPVETFDSFYGTDQEGETFASVDDTSLSSLIDSGLGIEDEEELEGEEDFDDEEDEVEDIDLDDEDVEDLLFDDEEDEEDEEDEFFGESVKQRAERLKTEGKLKEEDIKLQDLAKKAQGAKDKDLDEIKDEVAKILKATNLNITPEEAIKKYSKFVNESKMSELDQEIKDLVIKLKDEEDEDKKTAIKAEIYAKVKKADPSKTAKEYIDGLIKESRRKQAQTRR